jgi:hypothetical protein
MPATIQKIIRVADGQDVIARGDDGKQRFWHFATPPADMQAACDALLEAEAPAVEYVIEGE